MDQEIKDTNQGNATEVTKKSKTHKKLGKKKIIIGVVILVAVLLLAKTFLGGGAPQGYPVTAGTALRTDLTQEVSIKGAVQGTDSASIYSSAPYRIAAITVEEGQRVTEGQVLAKLDADTIVNQYNSASITAQEAKRAYDTAASLYKEGAISKDEYLKAQSAYNTAVLALSSININENANVTSPISGTVTRINTSVGKLANGSTTDALFVVENLDKLQMKLSVSEFELSRIKIGQPVTITAEVLGGDSVPGLVTAIAPTGEQKTPGSTEMVIPIVIDVEKGDSNLIAGVTAKATIRTGMIENALTVPVDAILNDPTTDENFVLAIRDGLIVKVPVTIVLEGDFDVAVGDDCGLADNEQIVLGPTFDMVEGMPVTVME